MKYSSARHVLKDLNKTKLQTIDAEITWFTVHAMLVDLFRVVRAMSRHTVLASSSIRLIMLPALYYVNFPDKTKQATAGILLVEHYK